MGDGPDEVVELPRGPLPEKAPVLGTTPAEVAGAPVILRDARRAAGRQERIGLAQE